VRGRFPRAIPGGFRREVDAPVFISANGGYRSPAHQIGGAKSIHAWGTAANVYRIGDTFLCDARSIENTGQLQRRSAARSLFGRSDENQGKPTTISTSI